MTVTVRSREPHIDVVSFSILIEPQVRSIANHVRPNRQSKWPCLYSDCRTTTCLKAIHMSSIFSLVMWIDILLFPPTALLFSATFRRRIERLARDILQDPLRVVQGDMGEVSEGFTEVSSQKNQCITELLCRGAHSLIIMNFLCHTGQWGCDTNCESRAAWAQQMAMATLTAGQPYFGYANVYARVAIVMSVVTPCVDVTDGMPLGLQLAVCWYLWQESPTALNWQTIWWNRTFKVCFWWLQ